MTTQSYKILFAITLVAFAFTRILPFNPVLQMVLGVLFTALLLFALYRFYIDSGRKRPFLVAFWICLALEVISLTLSIVELVG